MNLEDIKSTLTRLDYPNIGTMEVEQVAELFHKNNRIFFLSWVLKTSFDLVIVEKNPKKLEIAIGNAIYGHGFCNSTEKRKFVDCTLDLPTTIMIFNKIFSYMLMPATEEDCGDQLFKGLEEFSKLDLNLFPEYGDIKLANQKMLKQNIEETNAKIEEVTKKLEEMGVIPMPTIEITPPEEHIAYVEMGLRNTLKNIEDSSFISLRACNESFNQRNLQFSREFLELLANDKNNLNCALKYLESSAEVKELLELSKSAIAEKKKTKFLLENAAVLELRKKSFEMVKAMEDY